MILALVRVITSSGLFWEREEPRLWAQGGVDAFLIVRLSLLLPRRACSSG